MSQDPNSTASDASDPLVVNPYQATSELGGSVGTDHRFVSGMVVELAKWQTFFAVMLIIGFVLMLGTIGLALAFNDGGDFTGSLMGSLCIGVAMIIFYLIPAVTLWQAAGSARRYATSGSAAQLSDFVSGQRLFWRRIGIIGVLMLGFYGLMVIIALVGGISMAAE